MKLLCIGRHPYLSGHIRRYFEELGLTVVTTDGLDDAVRLAGAEEPDVALCDYDLLASHPFTEWRTDVRSRDVPLLAVSLTRRPDEMILRPGEVAGSLYLPVVSPEDALAVLRFAARRGGVAVPAGASYVGRGARLTPAGQMA